MEDLIQDMINAYEADQGSIERGEPGLAKLKLLARVEELTSKQSQQDSFIDAGGLGAIREWLRLLPDNSLPNLTLRASLLNILRKLLPSITLENLKDSRIGMAVRDLIFHEEEIASNKRLANEIAESWLRQIFGRDTGHLFQKASEEDMRSLSRQTAKVRTQPDSEQSDDEDDGHSRRRTSAIAGLQKHNRGATTFKVQPVSRVSKARSSAIAIAGVSGERIARAVQMRQTRKPGSTTKVSVEGRGLQ
jgi:transcription factor SPN1